MSVLIHGSMQHGHISTVYPAHVKYSCALAVESHPSHDPAETKSTRSGHFLLSFDIPAQFP